MKKAIKTVLIVGLFLIVIIAFLGYNANKELVNAFDKINQKLDSVNAGLKIKEGIKYQELDSNSKDSLQINLIDAANDLRHKTEILKKRLLSNVALFEEMDNSAKTDSILFEGDQVTPIGLEFLNALYQYSLAINNFPTALDVSKYDDIINSLPSSTPQSKNWLVNNFKGFPVVASVTTLTSLQNDVLSINSILIN